MYNVFLASRSKCLKHKKFSEAVRPLIPLMVLFIVSTGWAFYSPNDVCDAEPRIFFFLVGTLFSNIAVSIYLLIYAHPVATVLFTYSTFFCAPFSNMKFSVD